MLAIGGLVYLLYDKKLLIIFFIHILVGIRLEWWVKYFGSIHTQKLLSEYLRIPSGEPCPCQ